MYKKWIALALFCAVLAVGIEVYVIKNLWSEGKDCEAFILKEDVKVGDLLEAKNLQSVHIKTDGQMEGLIQDPSQWYGKPFSKEVSKGKLMTRSDFEKGTEPKSRESIVLRLDYEQGHKGDLTLGEKVSFLCYRQGEVKLITDLIVSGKEEDLKHLGDEGYYITVSGKPESLEVLVLAKREGSLHILKKTAVHN